MTFEPARPAAGRRSRRRLAAAAAASLLAVASAAAADAQPAWPARLEAELAAIDAQQPGRLGAYVRDLDSGATAAHRADRRWYLASMVKVPVAIAVLRGIERGAFGFDTTVTLRTHHYVDGSGTTNHSPPGTPLAVRFLLEQMIVVSDNTATDLLLELVGTTAVNGLFDSLAAEPARRVTTLAETRRLIYGRLVRERAERLSGFDVLALRNAPSDAARVKLLARITGVPVAEFALPTLDAAYDAYYASGVNSGRLDAYAELLARLANGEALTAPYTEYLLNLMQRVVTGPQRIKAGLPPHARFAHKTGTQRRRTCDAGVVRWTDGGRERRAVVVACTRDEPSLERAESALLQVGQAVCRSGLLTSGAIDAPTCPAVAAPARGPAAARR